MNCDCGRDDILELGDGKELCLQCRAELKLGKALFCRAYAEQALLQGKSIQVIVEEQSAKEEFVDGSDFDNELELLEEMYLDGFTPSQGTAPIESFSKVKRQKAHYSRRWQEEKEARDAS